MIFGLSIKSHLDILFLLIILNKITFIKLETFPLRRLISCKAGYYLAVNVCYKCAPGEYSPKGYNSCIYCPAGTYSSKEGSSSCTKCPGGTYSSKGSTTCKNCTRGKFSPIGSSSCTDCPAGKYSLEGYSECLGCPGGTYSNKGSYYCTECLAGTYSIAPAEALATIESKDTDLLSGMMTPSTPQQSDILRIEPRL